jgi:hypothetical protein
MDIKNAATKMGYLLEFTAFIILLQHIVAYLRAELPTGSHRRLGVKEIAARYRRWKMGM